MDTAKTGAYLASLRKAAGMTQQDAADRLGVSNKTVSKWESGVSHSGILHCAFSRSAGRDTLFK